MGFNYTDSQIDAITYQMLALREQLENTSWWHFMKRSNLKDAIYFCETQAIGIGIDQALDDLEKAGFITIVPNK
jgi:hypothetical protein